VSTASCDQTKNNTLNKKRKQRSHPAHGTGTLLRKKAYFQYFLFIEALTAAFMLQKKKQFAGMVNVRQSNGITRC
jgi:hypothetical protein